MKELDFSKLVSQETFLNYCFQRDANDVAYWEEWLEENSDYKDQAEQIKTCIRLVTIPISKKVIDHDFQILKRSMSKKNRAIRVITNVKLWPLIAPIAAVVLVIVSVIYLSNYCSNPVVTETAKQLVNDIKPGFNKVTLKLANGKEIALGDFKISRGINTIGLTYHAGNSITYFQLKYSKISAIAMLLPSQYGTALPDRTIVQNSASTLKLVRQSSF